VPEQMLAPNNDGRALLARRVDVARELLRPHATGDKSYEARLARRCWRVLSDVAQELVDEHDGC